jgi:arginyl-tRNA synthetase
VVTALNIWTAWISVHFSRLAQQNNKYCINVIEEQQKNSIAQHRTNVLEAAYRRKRSR